MPKSELETWEPKEMVTLMWLVEEEDRAAEAERKKQEEG